VKKRFTRALSNLGLERTLIRIVSNLDSAIISRQ